MKGRAAIQKVMQGFIDAGAKELPLATAEVEAHGDIGLGGGHLDAQGKTAPFSPRQVRGHLEEGSRRLEALPRHLEQQPGAGALTTPAGLPRQRFADQA